MTTIPQHDHDYDIDCTAGCPVFDANAVKAIAEMERGAIPTDEQPAHAPEPVGQRMGMESVQWDEDDAIKALSATHGYVGGGLKLVDLALRQTPNGTRYDVTVRFPSGDCVRWEGSFADLNTRVDAIAKARGEAAEATAKAATTTEARELLSSINMSELAVAAAAMHEMYVSLRAAGFETKEALYLVGVMTVIGGQQPPKP